MKVLLGVLCFGLIGLIAADNEPAWGYECVESVCSKVELTPENIKTAVSLSVCRTFCGRKTPGTLWPKPTGTVKLGQYVVHLDIDNIEIRRPPFKSQDELWSINEERFKAQISRKVSKPDQIKKGGKPLLIKVSVEEESTRLNSETDESYKLLLSQGGNEIIAEIKAKTFFGSRHGLETLSQLIMYDDIRREIQVVAEGEVSDAPAYKHRGLLLDTARNYFSVESIKRVIDAMGMNKLNIFHWHITDSQSFPLIIKSRPELSKYGAYSPEKIYTAENVVDIVKYGKARGVQVIPEFDAPAHVGEGWQKYDMTACFNKKPWQKYCVEPPCGQLDPTVDGLYDVLEDIYSEMFEMFDNPDIFHMGGDEVSTSCWNTSERIQNWMLSKGWGLTEHDFIKLWGHFQENALKRVDKVAKREVPIVMWTSRLTELPFVNEYLDKNRYIIQIWTTGSDRKVQDLLKNGYKLILSNYDSLYFDCGGGGWVNANNNWCSPYIGWQKVYMNIPESIAGMYHSQIYGAEAAIWSEQIDETTVDSRFWPRASALAERMWSNPITGWRDAEPRMLLHRQRLVENGIKAERLQPEWCLQNENSCPAEH
uniref:beta-N-acetylhexosaminidase n=1 Tax=Dolopus genitalis TaxID=2488630 RepID=A0A3G5BIK2_DOLGE|nr:venom polypeptide [Dolopus genitalis]